MKNLAAIFFLTTAICSAAYYPAPQNLGKVQVVGIEARTGGLSYVSLENVVVGINSNDFSVVDGTLNSKGLASGGSYEVTNVNLTPFFAANPNYFITNARLIVATSPSFVSAKTPGLYAISGSLNPPSMPIIQISTDGGGNWFNATATNAPVLVSLYNSGAQQSGASNVIVNAYVNAASVGQTNDLTGQVVLVSQTVAQNSAVNVSGAGTIAASAASRWANYSAVATVNLNSHDLIFNPTWTVTFTNTTMRFIASGSDILRLTPGTTTGTAPFINTITLTTTNVTFQISAPNTPTVQYCTNLAAAVWTTLAGQTVTSVGGSWYVSAAKPASDNAFFRAYCSAAAGSGSAYINGTVQLAATTNRPAMTGSDVAFWNSNKVIYAVSSTKTNLLIDLR